MLMMLTKVHMVSGDVDVCDHSMGCPLRQTEIEAINLYWLRAEIENAGLRTAMTLFKVKARNEILSKRAF